MSEMPEIIRVYDEASRYLQKNNLQAKMDTNTRKYMYGLSKQAHNGDVRGPKPQDSQGVWKYEAWTTCQGMSKRDAMMAFIVEVKKLDPNYNLPDFGCSPIEKATDSAESPALSQASSDGGILGSSKSILAPSSNNASKRRISTGITDLEAGGATIVEGKLYKQRDVFKGWRARDFALQGSFLHYYMEKNDITPKKSMDVSGASIIELPKVTVGAMELYPFVITHPSTTKSYNLASADQSERKTWVAAITEASRRERSQGSEQGDAPYMGRLLDRRPHPQVGDDDMTQEEKAIADRIRPVNPEATLVNMPKRYAGKMENAVENLLDSVGEDAPTKWEKLYVKQGVTVYKAGGSSGASAICVRGEATLPYSPTEVFGTIMNSATIKTVNPQVAATKKVKLFSDNTFVEYMKCKQVWPTAVRDFCNLVHWRLLSDGKIIISSFSERFADLAPLNESHVRAELILGGYVITPVEGGKKTEVNYILQSDLKGNIPRSITSMVASQQPLLVANIPKVIEENRKRIQGMGQELPPGCTGPTNFDGLLYAYRNPHDYGVDSDGKPAVYSSPEAPVEATSSSTTGGTAPSNSTPRSRPSSAISPPVSTNSEVPHQSLGSVRESMSKQRGKSEVVNGAKVKETRVTLMTLVTLFIPVLAWDVVPSEYRTIAFILGLIISVRYVFRVHMGEARQVDAVRRRTALGNGNFILRLPIDLAKVTRYLKSKREETDVEVTLTSLILKAAGLAINQTDKGVLNGHIFAGAFYPSREGGVDVSVTTEIGESDMATFKVLDADRKPVECIATELRSKRNNFQSNGVDSNSFRAKLRAALPQLISNKIDDAMDFMGTSLGLTIPFLGIEAFPMGVCTVLTTGAILRNNQGEEDMSFIPNFEETSVPLHITVEGVRSVVGCDDAQKITITPKLRVCIAVNSKAVNVAEARELANRFCDFLNDPATVDKSDRRHAQMLSRIS